MRVEFTFYGGAREWTCYHGPEAILHGPAETGKTLSALWKVHLCALKYAKASIVILRKTQTSAYSSVLQTYINKVLMEAPGITAYGGNKPEWYDYPNGARVWIAGLDKPAKVLSSEHDMIYVNQTEELDLQDWETLTTRTTGRAGHMPYAQTIGDCNPAWPTHWMYHRPSLRMFYSQHRDNPALFDPATGAIMAQGERTMAVLNALTGVRRDRLRDGKPSQAEGAVYEEWNASLHLIPRFEIPADWRRFRVVDFGYTNAFVCQWWAVDHDGRMYRYREMYHTGRTVADHAKQITALSAGERIENTICDHDAEDRATLAQANIPNGAARKEVSVGIQAVKERLKLAGDGRPRLYLLRDSLVESDGSLLDARKPKCTEEEVDAYVWNDKARKEEPLKADDHGMDALRYAVMYVDEDSGPLLLWGDG